MKYRLLRAAEIPAALWHDMEALRDTQAHYDDPFFDPDFIRLMAEVREDTRIGLAEQGSMLIGYWGLHMRPGNWARPIGGPFSDWQAPVLKADADLCPEGFLKGLGLSGMSCNGYKPVSFRKSPAMQREGANIARLEMGWPDYLSTMSALWPKHYKNMRRVHRKIDREFSERRFIFDDHSSDHFHQLIEIKKQQYSRTGRHDVLGPDWVRKLLDRLRSFQGRRLRARLSTLLFDGKVAAAEFNLQSDRLMHGWLVMIQPEYSVYSPGHMILHDLFPCLIESGLTAYDFGPGQDDYKRYYANFQLPIESGTLMGAPSTFSPMRAAGQSWRVAERHLPHRVAENMARIRRRTDQIVQTETDWPARLSGMLAALHKIRPGA